MSKDRDAGTHRVTDKLPKYIRSNIKKFSDYEYNKYDVSYTSSYFCSDFNITKLFELFLKEHGEFIKGSIGSEYFEIRILNRGSLENNKFKKVKMKSWNRFKVQLPLSEIIEKISSELTPAELSYLKKLLITDSANPSIKDKKDTYKQMKISC